VVPELPDLVSQQDRLHQSQSPRDAHSPARSGTRGSYGTPGGGGDDDDDDDGGTHVYVHRTHALAGQTEDSDTAEVWWWFNSLHFLRITT